MSECKHCKGTGTIEIRCGSCDGYGRVDELSDGAQWLFDQACASFCVAVQRELAPQERLALEQGAKNVIDVLKVFEILPEEKLLELRAWANKLPEKKT